MASDDPPARRQLSAETKMQSPESKQQARGAQGSLEQSEPKLPKDPPAVSQPVGVSSEHTAPKQHAPIVGGGQGEGAHDVLAPSKTPPEESHSLLNRRAQDPFAKQQAPGAGTPNSPPRDSISSRYIAVPVHHEISP